MLTSNPLSSLREDLQSRPCLHNLSRGAKKQLPLNIKGAKKQPHLSIKGAKKQLPLNIKGAKKQPHLSIKGGRTPPSNNAKVNPLQCKLRTPTFMSSKGNSMKIRWPPPVRPLQSQASQASSSSSNNLHGQRHRNTTWTASLHSNVIFLSGLAPLLGPVHC